MSVHISAHPLIQHKLARLRDARTPPPEFRELVAAISRGLFFEATADMKLRDERIVTPLTTTTCRVIAEKIGLIPVQSPDIKGIEAYLASEREKWGGLVKQIGLEGTM